MIHHKFDTAATTIINAAPMPVNNFSGAPLSVNARVMSALIILALPLVLLWLLAAWLWSDLQAVGRAISQFHKDAAEEYSRLS